MAEARRYWAFLSYSHKDRAWARWLHRALETWAVPRRFVGKETAVGTVPRRLQPIFRDREDLAADADLRGRVAGALENANFLIVICSPNAAKSAWVEDEIVRFKSLHGESRVLAVIVGGTARGSSIPGREAEECFPAALRSRVSPDGSLTGERADPIAADLRPHGDGRRPALLKLLARMLEVDLDDLARRDSQRRHAQLLGLATASTIGALAMGALAVTAVVARNEAQHQRAQAEGLVEFMLGDLRRQLAPEGRLDVLDAVGGRAMAYYQAQSQHGLDADALGRRARVLHLLGENDDKRGDLGAALTKFGAAAASTAELLARDPADPQRVFDHAQSVYWVGYIADRRGDEKTAEAQFQVYKRLADDLVRRDPRKDNWLAEVSYADADLGILLLKEGQPAPAESAFEGTLRVTHALSDRAPTDRDRRMALGQAYAWLSDAEVANGELDQALARRLSERVLYEDLLHKRPTDAGATQALIVNETAVGRIFDLQGRVLSATAELHHAAQSAFTLIQANPDNTEYRGQYGLTLVALARLALRQGNLTAAAVSAGEAASLAEALIRKDSSVAAWKGPLLGGARLIQIRVAATRATTVEERRRALSPAIAEAKRLAYLDGTLTADPGFARVLADANLLAGDYERLSGNDNAAEQDWRSAVSVLRDIGRAHLTPHDRGLQIISAANERLNSYTSHHGATPTSTSRLSLSRRYYSW